MPSPKIEQELSERLWEKIYPMLPVYERSPKGGRPRCDDKFAFFGIVFVLRSGCRWQDLPREYGSPTTVWRRFATWQKLEIWQKIWDLVLFEFEKAGGIDKSETIADATFIRAKKGGPKSEIPRLVGV